MAASTGALPITAPDSYGTRSGQPGWLTCVGAQAITMQVFNASIVWQAGIGSPPLFDDSPEINQAPAYRSGPLRCDAIRYRAAVPAAQLPAGQTQATVSIDTLP